MQVRVSQAIRMITTFIKAKIVPLLKGSPGCGKSQIYKQIADTYNLLLIDIRLSTCDLTDLTGFPQIVGNKAGYVPMNTFPIEGDPLPTNPVTGEEYSGWMILFDEITSAVPALQAASYKIILDRMVGIHRLHSNVILCAAGNLETDNAVVHPMSTALQSRMAHLELIVCPKEWNDWATEKKLDHRITSYMAFKPDSLFTFKSDHTDDTYACPRTWEFADRVLKVTEENSPDRLPMLAGTLSEGVAREFMGFCKIHQDLPTLAQILASPDSIKVPEEPSILFALTGAIGHNASQENFGQLIKYVNRMPSEFQVVALRETTRRNKAMMGHASVSQWLNTNKEVFF